jgi:hypothetical protein
MGLVKLKSSFGDVIWNPRVTIDWVRTSKILYTQVEGIYSLKVISFTQFLGWKVVFTALGFHGDFEMIL